MMCPKCKQQDQLKTIDSRPAVYGVKRRKECLSCGHRFTTIEIAVPKKIRADDFATKFYKESE